MSVYQYERQQLLHASLDEVWNFISNPRNLRTITPDHMGFNISSGPLPDKMYVGQIISYKVSPVLGIPLNWVTEISHISEQEYFVDRQIVGPYRLWHHEHFLTETADGVLMKDLVTYKPPMGILGKLSNTILIKKKIRQIFDYREKMLFDIFNDNVKAGDAQFSKNPPSH